MTQLVFWLSALLVVYIYVGYPLLVRRWPSVRPVRKDDVFLPSVSILVPAFNEEREIEATLRNKLAQDYPRELLEIIVVSDESTDGTDAIVQRIAAEADIPVTLVRQVPRAGKTSGLNLIVPQAKGEILVFSDANSIYAVDTVRKLVRNFADPDVGYVTGKMVYTNPDGSLVGDGCSAYMKYENMLREGETRMGSIVGVDGGVDAMRKSIHSHLNPDQLPDFVQPLKVVEQGYRVVYEPDALLKEPALNESGREYRMRVRVSLRALWALHDMRQLLTPAFGVYAFQLWSHKLLRYLAFVPLITVLLANAALWGNGGFYGLALYGQLGFYALALLGHRRSLTGASLPTVLALPYYFCLLNVASAHATWRYLKGEKQVIWAPRVG